MGPAGIEQGALNCNLVSSTSRRVPSRLECHGAVVSVDWIMSWP